MKKYIDTHAHYGHSGFRRLKKSTADIIKEMSGCCEKIIQVGTNTKSNEQAIRLTNNYDIIYGMVGYFPTDVWELEKQYCEKADENWLVLTNQLADNKIVGIGEIGLDYNWNRLYNGIEGEEARKAQKKWFRNQLNLARDMGLPVSIHSRDAESDTLSIFDEYDTILGVIHCFSYGRLAAQKAIDKGLYLGIGGTSTYPSNVELREAIKMAPFDRLLLETDAPYLSPQKVRREVNTSANIKYVIENIAEIKNCSIDRVIEQTNENAYNLFSRLK
jgi:TatD DNase family protein